MLKSLIVFLIKIFGFRLKLWMWLMLAALVVYFSASLSGTFNGWNAKGGPFSLVTLFGLSAFLILIPFGYIVEHKKEAVSLKFIGWIYFLYLSFAFLLVGYLAISVGDDILGSVIRGFIACAFYATLSVPLSIILAIIRFLKRNNNQLAN